MAIILQGSRTKIVKKRKDLLRIFQGRKIAQTMPLSLISRVRLRLPRVCDGLLCSLLLSGTVGNGVLVQLSILTMSHLPILITQFFSVLRNDLILIRWLMSYGVSLEAPWLRIRVLGPLILNATFIYCFSDGQEQNRDVDHLASLGYDLPFGLLNFKSAQDSISNILLNDVLGRAFERAVIC
ncbi:unnamed protein product [Prunus armeniaca]